MQRSWSGIANTPNSESAFVVDAILRSIANACGAVGAEYKLAGATLYTNPVTDFNSGEIYDAKFVTTPEARPLQLRYSVTCPIASISPVHLPTRLTFLWSWGRSTLSLLTTDLRPSCRMH